VTVTAWLPLISSLLVASVTLVGIRVNNRTNQKAILAADTREHHKWLRETALRQCGEAIQTALLAADEFLEWSIERSGKDLGQLRVATQEFSRKLGANISVLHMLDARKSAGHCNEMREMLVSILEEAEILDKAESRRKSELFEQVGYLDELREELPHLMNAEFQQLGRSKSPQGIKPTRTPLWWRARHASQ
jgi:hypothetical protein